MLGVPYTYLKMEKSSMNFQFSEFSGVLVLELSGDKLWTGHDARSYTGAKISKTSLMSLMSMAL